MRADWSYVSGNDDLEELSSAVQHLPTVGELEQALLEQGRPATFEERLEDAGVVDEAENFFGLIHSHRERTRLPLLQGLTWGKWMTLLEHTSILPERPDPPRPPRVPAPIPLHRTGRWNRQLVSLGKTPTSNASGTTPSAPTSSRSSAPGRRRTTPAATTL